MKSNSSCPQFPYFDMPIVKDLREFEMEITTPGSKVDRKIGFKTVIKSDLEQTVERKKCMRNFFIILVKFY